MSEIGPHDTLHLEWIIHICLRHIWGTYPQCQLNKITKKVTPGVYKFDVCFHIVRNKPQNPDMMLLGSDMFSLLQLDISMHSILVGTSVQLV